MDSIISIKVKKTNAYFYFKKSNYNRMMDSIKKLKWRYAVKKFDSTKFLSDLKIEILKEAFNLTATSYGLQPIKLVIVNDKEIQDNLVKCSFGQQQIIQASHILIFCIENQINEKYIRDYFNLIKKIRNTSDEILQPFQEALITTFSKKDANEIRIWAINQAYLAMGNLLTVCAMEEIDACPMEGFLADGYDDILNLKDKNLTSVLVMPVGYRAEDDIFSNFDKVRKSINDSIIQL
tara:strand:+ start:128 stop:835 length:708 start_codon:yes stop_codon:yes gene_type:complete